ncbi:hypothetical protein B0H16DRAFT_1481599 [Mycena metata]|uniref:Uncharacterized protein n=1 Tax=Mycena metata TaxID=1033252 RepID=A0AAD7GXE8_9AGAR|nr:hypothetical protein B0H16DRAFT_1481599 [Mycena metata]
MPRGLAAEEWLVNFRRGADVGLGPEIQHDRGSDTPACLISTVGPGGPAAQEWLANLGPVAPVRNINKEDECSRMESMGAEEVDHQGRADECFHTKYIGTKDEGQQEGFQESPAELHRAGVKQQQKLKFRHKQ